jgi:hypothetical protein
LTLVNVSALATSPLFDPLGPALARIGGTAFPSVAQLNALLEEMSSPVVSGGGRPIRFVVPSQGEVARGYEAGIFQQGCVPTRPNDWHDLFNALVWLTFPRTKAALNERHMRGMAAQAAAAGTARGALRDAATLFDESGVVVLSSDPQLWELQRDHQWRELFWQRRSQVVRHMRFYVFGHATYDQLRAPFSGLCAKAVFLEAADALLQRPLAEQLREIDAALASRWSGSQWYQRPRELAALPLLGIPGVTPDSETPAYYDDARQFRPRRSA